MSKTVTVVALSPVKCGGKRHEPGDSFSCDEATAKALVASGDAMPEAEAAKAKAEWEQAEKAATASEPKKGHK